MKASEALRRGEFMRMNQRWFKDKVEVTLCHPEWEKPAKVVFTHREGRLTEILSDERVVFKKRRGGR